MKKTFILIVTLLSVSTFVACAKGKNNENKVESTEPLVITIGTQDNADSITGKGLTAINEKLMEISDGQMELDIFTSSQLGDYKAMANQVTGGELDMFVSGYPDMSFLVPAFEVIGEPYVVTSYEQMRRVTESDFAKDLHAQLNEKNIHFLDLWYTGARQVTSSRPLNSIEDFKGLKLRTPNVPFLIHFAESAGAIPSPIAFQEVYLALQTNQVEAEENPLTTINAMKFYEVQKYIAMTSHYIATKAVWVNTPVWESLSEEQQSWLQSAIAAGREENDALAFADEEQLLQSFQDDGLTITYPDLVPFQEAMKPFYAQLDEKYGDGVVASLQNL